MLGMSFIKGGVPMLDMSFGNMVYTVGPLY